MYSACIGVYCYVLYIYTVCMCVYSATIHVYTVRVSVDVRSASGVCGHLCRTYQSCSAVICQMRPATRSGSLGGTAPSSER